MASALGRRGLVLNRSLLRRPTAVAARKCSGGSSGGSSGTAATQPDVEPAPPTAEEKKKMSLAMKHYMEKKQDYDAFMNKERDVFELGKKHLANMMGNEKRENMTQEEIDAAIQYLFPSGLEEKGARPLMKPPEEIFPLEKGAEFNVEGRPFNPFFYTAVPKYVGAMHSILGTMNACMDLAESNKAKGIFPDEHSVLSEANLSKSRWMSKAEIEAKFREDLRDGEYTEMIDVLERLMSIDFSYKFKDFLFQYRVVSETISNREEAAKPLKDEHNRDYVENIGQRKSACAQVRVTKPGTGKFSIVHIDYPDVKNDITYFYGLKERHQIMYPLQFTDLLGKVDVSCVVDSGGPAGQAGAIRYALSLCLRSFVDKSVVEDMIVGGLLTQNIAVPEREKPGKTGPRRSRHFRKR